MALTNKNWSVTFHQWGLIYWDKKVYVSKTIPHNHSCAQIMKKRRAIHLVQIGQNILKHSKIKGWSKIVNQRRGHLKLLKSTLLTLNILSNIKIRLPALMLINKIIYYGTIQASIKHKKPLILKIKLKIGPICSDINQKKRLRMKIMAIYSLITNRNSKTIKVESASQIIGLSRHLKSQLSEIAIMEIQI